MIDLSLTLPDLLLLALAVAMLLALARLWRGPSLADRVIALDLMATLGLGMLAIYAVAYEQPVYLDIALVTALISFVGTIAFARYLERRATP